MRSISFSLRPLLAVMVMFCSRPVALSLRGHVQDTVRVDVERDFDLRHAARRGRDTVQNELAQRLVVRRHRALALNDVNLHLGLPVRRRAEDLALLGRDRRVALDQRRRHAAQRFDRPESAGSRPAAARP